MTEAENVHAILKGLAEQNRDEELIPPRMASLLMELQSEIGRVHNLCEEIRSLQPAGTTLQNETLKEALQSISQTLLNARKETVSAHAKAAEFRL